MVAVFVSSEVLARYLGIRFATETLGTLYQYLDLTVLREDLARGLYYRHAQPPLFNFFLGVVVKMFPESYSAVFSALYAAMTLGMLEEFGEHGYERYGQSLHEAAVHIPWLTG